MDRKSVEKTRFIIGIDLGTTNSVLSYIDTESSPEVNILDIPQTIAPGEEKTLKSLPSFFYIPLAGEKDLYSQSFAWQECGISGVHARDYGGRKPERFISSAKSWLSHAGIDRLAPILPWVSRGAEQDFQHLSPVEVSTAYLRHLGHSWNRKFAKQLDKEGNSCGIEDQQVILTIPASFDETARELTVKAARDAGFKKLFLIEEPLAAFYDFLARHENWQKTLTPGKRVVIVDIGGGTSDFSLIEVCGNNSLRRMAVGDHLLLGGDNIDLALAKFVCRKAAQKPTAQQWGGIIQDCRAAKELMLNDEQIVEAPVSVSGSGSSLIASSWQVSLTRAEVLKIVVDGFFPDLPIDTEAPKQGAALQEMGLPYSKEPAMTRHLLHFLKSAVGKEDKIFVPDYVLFNGGTMLPEILRKQILLVLNKWSEEHQVVEELKSADLDKAVACGAAHYGEVRTGSGLKVEGGIARSYFLETETTQGRKLVCIMPRDTAEGITCLLDKGMSLTANQPVLFSIYSSATRLGDKLGDIIEPDDDVRQLPPLATSLKYGRKQQQVPVGLSTILTETGTLEVWLNSEESDHRWKLNFDMRALHKEGDEAVESGLESDTTLSEDQVEAALLCVRNAFEKNIELNSVMKNLEGITECKRDRWTLAFVRRVTDLLIELKESRLRSPEAEARWLNLAGFCMRPGVGEAADSWRIRQFWALWFNGVKSKTNSQVQAEWWVFWRRVAAGLKKGHQQQVSAAAIKSLLPKGVYKSQTKYGAQEKREMWRCLGALELIQQDTRLKIADLIVSRGAKAEDYELWVLGRLASRVLVYGGHDNVVPATKVAPWCIALIEAYSRKTGHSLLHFALHQMAAVSPDKSLDIPDETRSQVAQFLKKDGWQGDLEQELSLKNQNQKQLLADSLPLGLQIFV